MRMNTEVLGNGMKIQRIYFKMYFVIVLFVSYVYLYLFIIIVYN